MYMQSKPKTKNLLQLENQNMEELARKEEIRKAYQRDLMAQIEAQKKLKEQERLRKLKEDQEEDRRIKQFLGISEPQPSKDRRNDPGSNTSLQPPKLKYKDELDKFALQQSNHCKSQQNFNVNRQEDILDLRLNNTAITAKSLVKNDISRQYIKNSKGFEMQRPTIDPFDDFPNDHGYNFKPKHKYESNPYAEQRRVYQASGAENPESFFVKQIDHLKKEILQMNKQFHGELIEIRQKASEALQEKQVAQNDLKEMKQLLVNLQTQHTKPHEIRAPVLTEENQRSHMGTLDAIDQLLVQNKNTRNRVDQHQEPLSVMSRPTFNYDSMPLGQSLAHHQQPYLRGAIEQPPLFGNNHEAVGQPMTQKQSFEYNIPNTRSNNFIATYDDMENIQPNHATWKPNKKFPNPHKESSFPQQKIEGSGDLYGRLEAKSHFIPISENTNPLVSYNLPATHKPVHHSEMATNNFSFRRPQELQRDRLYDDLEGRRANAIDANDSINFLLEKYETMEIELDPQYQKADHFDFDYLQNLINWFVFKSPTKS